jgi:sugar phosphate isomerase/epimerase
MRLGIAIHSMGIPDNDIIKALERCRELGIMALNCGIGRMNDTGYLNEVKSILDETGIELIIGFGDKFIENGDKQPTDKFVRFVEQYCVPLGVTRIPTCSTHHRWRKDPPLDEQLERLAQAFTRLCRAAEPYGVRFAIENHADYRGTDLVRLFRMVDHPLLRAQLDTGNAFVVAEDPVDAAEALAPYVISTHIKDMTVRPLTEGEWMKVKGCGIGEGDVDFHRIVEILVRDCPEADDLPYNLEIEPPHGADLHKLTEEGVQYTIREFGEYIRHNARKG